MRSPLKTLPLLLQCLSSSLWNGYTHTHTHTHTHIHTHSSYTSCVPMHVSTYARSRYLWICVSAPLSVCPPLCMRKYVYLCVLVKRWSCSVFSTPHCDAEAPDWAMTHHGLSARSLRSDTKEYRQAERQRDIPRGTGLTSAWTWAWNPPPGRSHSTKITSENIAR